ncbi:MAG: phosphate signaling complex protein PhoU [Fidelibacterota bacterium]
MLDRKITELEEKLFSQASLVEHMVAKSINSLVEKEESLAREVIEVDEVKVNSLEIEIEDFALNLLALYQPEAADLRKITMIIKMNNDLERIGDHAVNIAERALFLIPRPQVKPLIDIPRMADGAIKMLKDSLDSFVKENSDLAVDVCKRDSEIDSLQEQITRELITYMMGDPKTINRALMLILVSRDLERVADLATNISEDVVFMLKGKIIKHHKVEK